MFFHHRPARSRARLLLAAMLSCALPAAMAADSTPVPLGGEKMVNTDIRASQQPDIGRDAFGNYVITWSGLDAEGSFDVYARRYSGGGRPLGPEFRVNSSIAGFQGLSVVGVEPLGGFLILWSDQSDSQNGVLRGQRYSALGLPLGAEFPLNPDASRGQYNLRLAMRPAGGFVATWTEQENGHGYLDVYVRRYHANGTPDGPALVANTYTNDHQTSPAVAVGMDGRYTVAWESYAQDLPDGASPYEDGMGVYAQRFNHNGGRVGGEFRVAQSIMGSQHAPSVAYKPTGGFTIGWSGAGAADAEGMYLRRYDAEGRARGGEILANGQPELCQVYGSVSTDRRGREIVSWISRDTCTEYHDSGIRGRRYDNDGTPMGQEFDIAEIRGNLGVSRTAAIDADGDFVALWSRWSTDPSDANLNTYFRRFRGTEPVDLGIEIHSDTTLVLPGATVSFDLDIRNIHALADLPGIGASSGIALDIALPGGAQLLSLDADAAWNCVSLLPPLCFLDATVAASGVAPPLRLTLRAPQADGPMNLSAAISADQADPLAANNTGEQAVQVKAPPPPDTTPDVFDFVDQTGVPLKAQVLSNVVTVTGINRPTAISVGGSNVSYSVNGAAFTSQAGTVQAGDRVQLRITSSGLAFFAARATATIGGVTDNWLVRTGLKLR